MPGDLFDGANQAAGARFARGLRQLLQSERGKKCPGPGAEVLGGYFLAADFAQIIIDLGRADCLPLARIVETVKKLVAWQIAAALDNAREAPVAHAALVPYPAFAAKGETDPCWS
jgi:hypothetical protein